MERSQMENTIQPFEEDAKIVELADKLSAVCVGYSCSAIRCAMNKLLYERLPAASVFTGKTDEEPAR